MLLTSVFCIRTNTWGSCLLLSTMCFRPPSSGRQTRESVIIFWLVYFGRAWGSDGHEFHTIIFFRYTNISINPIRQTSHSFRSANDRDNQIVLSATCFEWTHAVNKPVLHNSNIFFQYVSDNTPLKIRKYLCQPHALDELVLQKGTCFRLPCLLDRQMRQAATYFRISETSRSS